MTLRHFVIPALLLAGGVGVAAAQGASGAANTVVVRVDHPGPAIGSMLYGFMTEEINHSYDGGLYAELIQNRAFKDDPNEPVHWAVTRSPGAAGTIALSDSAPLNSSLNVSLRLDVTAVAGDQRVGAANEGFWGINVTPNTKYRVSLYARGSNGFTGPLTVDLESSDGETIHASGVIPHVTEQWAKYDLTIATNKKAKASTNNRFVVSAKNKGTVWLSLVSVFPPTFNNRPNGNRIDLMQTLGDMKPAFLRLPGGNYLEGNSIAERFAWKNTIGPVEERAGHPGPWRYRSSDGLGLMEFLLWCDDLHMEPVLGVFDGYALNGEHAEAGKPLEPYVQDALEEIEYVIGGPDTKWGQQRAKDGHPAPFPLRYVEIGNEEGGPPYEQRFAQFFDAIKAKYPQLQLIATDHVKSRKADVYDDHYYLPHDRMEREMHHYDDYPRTDPKIFVGEWATVEGSPTPTLEAALADATWMMGMERNADVVIMAAYAPLLVNVNPNAWQWGTNMIGYDAGHVFGSPSYYAQRMFMTHRGTHVLPVEVAGEPPKPAPGAPVGPLQTFFASATRDSASGNVFLKVVNTADDPETRQISLTGVSSVDSHATVEVMSGQLWDMNSVAEPTKVAPQQKEVKNAGTTFTYSFPAHSVSVMVLKAK